MIFKVITVLPLAAILLPSTTSLPHQRASSITVLDRYHTVLPYFIPTTLETQSRHQSPSKPAEVDNTARLVIVNGTNVKIDYTSNGFVYCWTNASTATSLDYYKVQWRCGEKNSREWSLPQKRFTVGSGHYIPHSYLVFTSFTSDLACNYACVLLHRGQEVDRSSVMVT